MDQWDLWMLNRIMQLTKERLDRFEFRQNRIRAEKLLEMQAMYERHLLLIRFKLQQELKENCFELLCKKGLMAQKSSKGNN